MKTSAKRASAKGGGRGRQPRKAIERAAPAPKMKGQATKRTATAPSLPAEPACRSKQAAVIALLRRQQGATVAEVMAATGWQRHTVRGLFSGTLKKKLGLMLISNEEDRGRVYRILDPGETGAARVSDDPGAAVYGEAQSAESGARRASSCRYPAAAAEDAPSEA